MIKMKEEDEVKGKKKGAVGDEPKEVNEKKSRGKSNLHKEAEPTEKEIDKGVEIEKKTQSNNKIQKKRKGVDPPVSKRGKEKAISDSENEDDANFVVDKNVDGESEDVEEANFIDEEAVSNSEGRNLSQEAVGNGTAPSEHSPTEIAALNVLSSHPDAAEPHFPISPTSLI
ncbi:hypothetical protein Dimus_000846 [Dionaea muscipula]